MDLKEINSLRKKFKAQKEELDKLAKEISNEKVELTFKVEVDLSNYEDILENIDMYGEVSGVSAKLVTNSRPLKRMKSTIDSFATDAVTGACDEIYRMFPKFNKLKEKYQKFQSDVNDLNLNTDFYVSNYNDLMYALDSAEAFLEGEDE